MELDSAGDVALVSMEGGQQEEPLIEEPFGQLYPEVSRDGRWIAYQSSETGQNEIYVQPFPNVDEGIWQISPEGGVNPLWRPEGRELFYRSLAGDMMVVPTDTESTFNYENPVERVPVD